jgi:hypothetical protein
MYPEDLLEQDPVLVARSVRELGLDAVSVALTYHRSRRVFPRARQIVRWSPPGAIYFTPELRRYGRLVPVSTAHPALPGRISALRRACDREGVGFRAWLVVLHHEPLARMHPALAATSADGSPTDFALCPSSSEAREYACALVADVCAQFAPDAVDAEALLYTSWEPSYTDTIALTPQMEEAAHFASQCFCVACCALASQLGIDAHSLQSATLEAAWPHSSRHSSTRGPVEMLRTLRARGIERICSDVAEVAHSAGSALRILTFGHPDQLAMQGVSVLSVASADGVTLGLGTRTGAELSDALVRARDLIAGLRTYVGTTWAPGRDGPALVLDLEEIEAHGVAGVSFYNLSLLPNEGIEALRALKLWRITEKAMPSHDGVTS